MAKSGHNFRQKIKTENGNKITVQSDEILILGGGGTAPLPLEYYIFGLIACYAGTFAKWAAMDGIILKSFKIKAISNMDLTRSFGVTKNPVSDHLKWEIIADANANIEELNRLNEITKERCPGYYCMTHPIFPDIKIIKR